MRNKHSIGRRFLALLLCALMMVGLMPTTALAATTVSNATELQNAIKNAKSGDTIKLGGNITFSGDSGLRTMTNLYQNKQVTYELTLFREVTSERYVMSPVWTQVSVRDDGSALLPDSYKRVNIVTGEEKESIKLEGKYNPNTVREHGDATAYLFVENKNLTIDLNGYTISGSRKDAYLSTLFVTGSSKVTIMDSRSGGRITSSGSAVTAHGKDAKVTIKSGSFQGDQSAVAAIYNGTIDIQGGSFTGYSQAEKTVTTYHSGEQTIEGVMSDDKFKKTRIERDFDFSITRTRQSGILFINSGGTITVSGKPAFQVLGSGNLSAFENGEGSIKISGGTFNTPPKANEIASGYCILYKDGGTCEVVPVNDSRVVARVRTRSGYTSYCTSLSEAIKLAQDGDIVTLIKNISEGQNLNNNSTYTLDLGGNTINGNVTVKTGNVTIRNGTISYTGTGNALKTEGNSAVLTADCIVNAPNGTALSAGGGTVNAIGGTYTGKTTVATSAGGTLTITGGRYKPDDPSAYLAEGLYAILDTDRYYMVTDTPFIQIWNKDDLLAFVQKVNAGDAGANAVLMADINLSGVTWTPIKKFSGSFNGNGHSITNFNSTKGGLFNRIETGGVVSNVTIKSGSISGDGAIASLCYGTIQGCFNYASVSGTSGVGGIVGALYGNVERCGNYGEIKGEIHVGGIVGNVINSNIIIKNCYNTGTISATKAEKEGYGYFDGTTWEGYYYTGAGGICGPGNYFGRLLSFSVDNCFNYGTISANKDYFVPVALNGSNNWHLDTTAKNCAIPGYASKGSNKSVFASGELAYALNGGEEGVWYQTLGVDPYPVLDPTHARVYKVGSNYYNYTFNSIVNPSSVTVPGGTPVAGITSKLPKTVSVNSDKPGGGLTAEVTWDTSALSKYDPDNWEKQTFTLSGTAYVTGLKNGGEQTASITVTVNAVTVQGIEILSAPKTRYNNGDPFDPSNAKYKVTYNDVDRTEVELSYDSPGVEYSTSRYILTQGTVLDKATYNGATLRITYQRFMTDHGQLQILSTDNTIQSIKVGETAAVPGEDGSYTVTLQKGSSLPEESAITITPADSSVKSVTKSPVEGSNDYWEITVVAESGDTATYYLEVLIDGWNKDTIDSLKQAWDNMDNKKWEPTQAEVQQGTSEAGDDNNPSYEVQLKAWLLQTMVERGLEIPRNVDIDISFTQGPDWATAGDRYNNRDGEDGKFEFSITFTATQGSEDTHETVTFDSQSGIITATPYAAPDYTVHFNSGGGSTVTDLIVKEDDVIGDKAPADPTFEHYTFLGWFTEQTGGKKWDMANDKVDKNNITLYAHWELTKYKVVLPENQHGYTLEADKEEVVWNESVIFTYKLGVGYNGDDLVIKVNGTPVTPDEKGQFTVGGNVDSDIVVTVEGVINAPTYTVTIPESVNLDSTATVSAAGVNVADGSSLYVAIGGEFTIANDNILFKQTIGYPIQKGGKDGIQIQPDDTVLTVAGGIANNTGSQVLYFGLPTEEPKYADDYKGTVTFRIGIKDTE